MGYDGFRSIGPVMANVNTTGQRTALWRGDLGTELPLLADCHRIQGRLWNRRGISVNADDLVLQSCASSSFGPCNNGSKGEPFPAGRPAPIFW